MNESLKAESVQEQAPAFIRKVQEAAEINYMHRENVSRLQNMLNRTIGDNTTPSPGGDKVSEPGCTTEAFDKVLSESRAEADQMRSLLSILEELI